MTRRRRKGRRRPGSVAVRVSVCVLVLLWSGRASAAAQDGGRLYQQACDDGDFVACDVLGLMYLAGEGVFQDLERAAALFRAACDGDEAGGCNHLGLMHHTGAGVPRDIAAAAGFYRRACELGEASACGNLETMGLMPSDTSTVDEYARSGLVVDARTRAPLSGAFVTVPDLGIRVVTGESGRVELGRLPSGVHPITAERVGYELLQGELPVPWDGEFLLLLNRLDVDDVRAPGRVLGRVTEEDGGPGLQDVAITVSGATRVGTLSDGQGRFQLTVEPGLVELQFTSLGYAPRETTLIVQPGRTVEIEASMSTQAIELDPIEVTVRSGYLERSGFYRRARTTRGAQFTREELDEIQPTFVSDLFWRVPGTYVRHGLNGAQVVSRRGVSFSRGPCTMSVYMDGMPMGGWDLDQIPPEWLEAVEVYQGSSTPIRYTTGLSSCGVVLLWTSRGR